MLCTQPWGMKKVSFACAKYGWKIYLAFYEISVHDFLSRETKKVVVPTWKWCDFSRCFPPLGRRTTTPFLRWQFSFLNLKEGERGFSGFSFTAKILWILCQKIIQTVILCHLQGVPSSFSKIMLISQKTRKFVNVCLHSNQSTDLTSIWRIFWQNLNIFTSFSPKFFNNFSREIIVVNS